MPVISKGKYSQQKVLNASRWHWILCEFLIFNFVHVVDIAILKEESRLPSLCLTKGYSFSVSCSLEKRFSHPFSFSFVLVGGGPYILQSSSSRITLFSKQVYPSVRIGMHCYEMLRTWFLIKFPGGLNFKVVSKCKAKGSIRSFYASYSWSDIIHLNRRVQIFYLRKVLTSFISKKRNPSARVLQGKKFLYKESDG